MIIIVETTPCFGSLCASTTTQTADLFGLYLRSSISDCNKIASRRSQIPCPVLEETQITGTSPPQSSETISYLARSCLI